MVAQAENTERVHMGMCVDVVDSPATSSGKQMVCLTIHSAAIPHGPANSMSYIFPPKHSLKLAYGLVIAAMRAFFRI